MEDIGQRTQQIAALTSDVNESISRQAQGMGAINNHATNLKSTTQQAEVYAASMEGLSQQLLEQVGDLESILGHFQVSIPDIEITSSTSKADTASDEVTFF